MIEAESEIYKILQTEIICTVQKLQLLPPPSNWMVPLSSLIVLDVSTLDHTYWRVTMKSMLCTIKALTKQLFHIISSPMLEHRLRPTLIHHWLNDPRRGTNAGLMLTLRLWRWPDISQILVLRGFFLGYQHKKLPDFDCGNTISQCFQRTKKIKPWSDLNHG